MNVLVTGGAGYIGSHTSKRLAAAGHLPVVVDDLRTGHRSAVRWGPLIEGDIADRALVRRVLQEHRIDAVIHFAASAYIADSMQMPMQYFSNNVTGSLALLDAMLDVGVRRIVFSSTCAVYGIPEHLPITEATPTFPINPYGESKLFVERALRWYGVAYGLEWVALRYFNAAGADPEGELGEDHQPEPHLIPRIIEACLDPHGSVEVLGADYPTPDGTAVRDYVHVSDLADAHLLAFDLFGTSNSNKPYNLATGRGYSVREVVDAVERVTSERATVLLRPRRPGDPPCLTASGELAQSILGWRPTRSRLDEMVASAWAWRTSK